MAALTPDPFDIGVLDELNEILTARCRNLRLFYESKINSRGKRERKIGFYYKSGDVEVSHIDLDSVHGNELPILYSFTADDMAVNFNRRKLNTCLRLLSGMIASKEGVGLKSSATNPISLYTMVKYFDCTVERDSGNFEDVRLKKRIKKFAALRGISFDESDLFNMIEKIDRMGIELPKEITDDMRPSDIRDLKKDSLLRYLKDPEVTLDVTQFDTLEKCKIFMAKTTPNSDDDGYYGDNTVSVSIKTKVPDYESTLSKLTELITHLDCVGLGGSRKKKRTRKRALK